MKRVILYTQENSSVTIFSDKSANAKKHRDAISIAAVNLAQQLSVAAIIAETKSGATAANIAAHRPSLPIISVTSESRSAQQLALSYANRSYVRPDGEEAGLDIAKELKAEGYFGEGEITVIIVSGRQPGKIGATDTIKVRVLE
jgi:pyruvate kinase